MLIVMHVRDPRECRGIVAIVRRFLVRSRNSLICGAVRIERAGRIRCFWLLAKLEPG
jgi:hypothetical protein